jgi:hypothetical protein
VADGLWHYDPTTGQTTFEATDGTLTDEQFIGPSNNPVYVAGGNVQSALTGGTLLTLGQQGETTFRTFGNGSLDVNSPISMRTLNNPLAEPLPGVRTYVQRQLAGDITVLDAAGNETVIHIAGVTTAPVGHQLLAYMRDDGTVDIQPKQLAVRSNAELQALPGFNARWRLATPTEIAEYAVGRYLAHEMPDELRELLRSQGVDESQLNPTDQYELASLFTIGDISNLQAYSRTWLFAPSG